MIRDNEYLTYEINLLQLELELSRQTHNIVRMTEFSIPPIIPTSSPGFYSAEVH